RNGRARHLRDARADRFALSALFGADPGIRAGRVDEGEDRKSEARAELVEASRFSVTLGVRHAEVSLHVVFGAAAFLMAHDDDAASAITREAADDRRVVGEGAIAVELLEIGEERFDVIE